MALSILHLHLCQVLVHTKLPLQNGVVIDGKLSVDGSVKQSIDQFMSSLCCNKTTAPITPNGSSECAKNNKWLIISRPY